MKTFVLFLCLAVAAHAEEPVKDVPAITDSFAQPFCLEPQERIVLAKKLVSLQAENESLKASVTMSVPVWVPIVVGVVALGAGVGAGYGISRAK